MALTVTQINQLYVSYFGRPADFQGVQFYQTNNATADQVAAAFASSQESINLYGTTANIPAQINAIYNNLFNRDAEPAGLTYWVQQVQQGKITAAAAALSIGNAAQGTDATTVANKVLVANAFVTALDTTAEILGYSGDNAAASARAFIKTVTATNLTTVQGTVDAAVAAAVAVGGTTGATLTLTTVVDNIVGTGGNDTISAVVDSAANGGTLTAGDVIDGGAGTDTLNAIITTAGKWAAGATIKNVENIVFRDTTAGDTVDLSNVTGATLVGSVNSTTSSTLTVNNIQANATLSLGGSNASLTTTFKDGTFSTGGKVSAQFSSAGTKTADRATLTVGHAATAGTATDLTLALSAVGNNFVTYSDGTKSAGTFKTVSFTGGGNLDIVGKATEFVNVSTVDASTATGGLTIDLGANNKDVTFTGGSGNDTLTLQNFNGTDSLDGGAGKDTLNVSLANVTAFTKAAPIKNFETLGIAVGTIAADTVVNGDYFGISNVTLTDTGYDLGGKTLDLQNLVNGSVVTIANSNGGTTASTIQLDVKGAIAGTADSLTLTLGKGVDLATKATTIAAAGVETLTIATNTTKGSGASIGTLTDAALTKLVITGSDGVTINTISAAAIASVDASGVVKDTSGNVGGVSLSLANSTSKVTFVGGAGADTYTASAKGDTITGGLGADTITLGAGADKLVYTAAAESTLTSKDTVANFTVNADSIQFAASLLKGTATYLGAGAFTNTGSTQLHMNGADLEVDLNGDTVVDMAITLTGVTAATFGAANFTFA